MATFSLAFHGLMRVGELTVGNKSSDTHTISFHDVKISNNILEVFILSSKTEKQWYETNSECTCEQQNKINPIKGLAICQPGQQFF
jgi:hypothetical protein